jgi:thiol-disulfide isomerase/thioredoxin
MWAFQASWCPPCHKMEPVLNKLENRGYKVRRIDVDINKELAEKYNINALPTFIIMKNGKEVSRKMGVVSFKILSELCRKA